MSDADNAALHGVAIKTIRRWRRLYQRRGLPRGQVIAGQLKRYDYPRWQFTNVIADIRELCCWALDLVDVPWRQSNRYVISVSTRAGVARLDELIGEKR